MFRTRLITLHPTLVDLIIKSNQCRRIIHALIECTMKLCVGAIHVTYKWFGTYKYVLIERTAQIQKYEYRTQT